MVPKEQNERGFRLDRSRDKKRNKAGERKRRWIQTTERSSTREKSVWLVKSSWNGRPVFLKQISTCTSDEASDIFDNSCIVLLQLGRRHIFICNKKPQSTDFHCYFENINRRENIETTGYSETLKENQKEEAKSIRGFELHVNLLRLFILSYLRIHYCTNKYCYTKFRQVYAQTYKYTLATNT